MRRLALCAVLAVCVTVVQASAQDSLERSPGESARTFAARVAPHGATLVHQVVETAAWGEGLPALLAFYSQVATPPETGEPEEIVSGYAYLPAESPRRYTRVPLGRIRPEGGAPQVRSVFLVHADADTILDVAVLVGWPVQHHDVAGTLHGTFVYRYDASDAAGFTFLEQLSSQVSGTCACEWRDGRRETSRFTTAAEVRREIARLRPRSERAKTPCGP